MGGRERRGRERNDIIKTMILTILTLVHQLVCSAVVSCQLRNHRNTQQTLESHL